jgi:hypothetical protein
MQLSGFVVSGRMTSHPAGGYSESVFGHSFRFAVSDLSFKGKA